MVHSTSGFYTGVGSRETPSDTCKFIHAVGRKLALLNYTLRSGGATGADQAFEFGCDQNSGRKCIYLATGTIHPDCFAIAESIHPAWHRCNDFARKLHARNVHQVLGSDLKSPSDFLVCWTRDGQPVGGTRTAILVAQQHQIPVYNLAVKSQCEQLVTLIRSLSPQ